MDQTQTCHIVFIPTPGMGHLIPLVELAKRILQAHHFTISFLVPSEGPPTRAQKSVLGELSKDGRADSFFLPPVNLDDLPTNSKIETRISHTLVRSLPTIRDHLRDIKSTCRSNLSALVVDLFGTDSFDLAWEFGMKPCIFFPSNAMSLYFVLHLPELDKQVSSEYRDMDEPVRLPGCVPLPGDVLLDPVQDRGNDAYKWVLHHAKRYKLAQGILVNSFMELEEGPLSALQSPKSVFPPVYAVGPLVQTGSNDRVDGSDCLAWLDKQPHGSVLFVSFGSGGTLSYDQLLELAHGLEMSEQRFLWVVRTPNDKVANATYFISTEPQSDPLHFIPKGFLERTNGRGLVVPDWAPQIDILSHESTGGFICHCGWNSILESVLHGVPLIAWPLYAEQRMNAVMLSEGLKIVVRPKVDEKGLVGRVQIAKVVKDLMEDEEGKQIRSKMNELKGAGARALSIEGSSTKALSKVARKWKST